MLFYSVIVALILPNETIESQWRTQLYQLGFSR